MYTSKQPFTETRHLTSSVAQHSQLRPPRTRLRMPQRPEPSVHWLSWDAVLNVRCQTPIGVQVWTSREVRRQLRHQAAQTRTRHGTSLTPLRSRILANRSWAMPQAGFKGSKEHISYTLKQRLPCECFEHLLICSAGEVQNMWYRRGPDHPQACDTDL